MTRACSIMSTVHLPRHLSSFIRVVMKDDFFSLVKYAEERTESKKKRRYTITGAHDHTCMCYVCPLCSSEELAVYS